MTFAKIPEVKDVFVIFAKNKTIIFLSIVVIIFHLYHMM